MNGNVCFDGEVDQANLESLARDLAHQLRGGELIFLQGNLGAGKTTFARALIQTLLPGTRVKSPTYTLVERYETPAFDLYHADLYRLADASELAPLGLREAVADGHCVLVEWPERAHVQLGRPTIQIHLSGVGDVRQLRIEKA